ncbi:kti12, chromatin associated [Kappamyces sp. JEL0829]|nr:kti12, chromatin associated [Kappamyces sp. JEL0829]
MPLVTIVGIPLSGKTTRANELAAYVRSRLDGESLPIRKIIVVNEENLELDKLAAYRDAESEKKARGRILSAVERHLCREDLVICDSLNYIKGFRYQLYCIARAMGTPACTLYCGASTETSVAMNRAVQHYDQSIVENLCSRFEEPDGRNRWDAPLFTLIKEDETLESSPTSEGILSALTKKPPAPNLSTVVKPIFDTNYLAQVDKVLGDIIDTAIEAQKNGRSGDIVVPVATAQVSLPSRFISLSEFRRIKRQYLHLNKSHTILDVVAIGNAFVDYLNTNLE